jgi:hypothetical protein
LAVGQSTTETCQLFYRPGRPIRKQKKAFGMRLFAAAFEKGFMCRFFKPSLESGSEQPHISEGALWAPVPRH